MLIDNLSVRAHIMRIVKEAAERRNEILDVAERLCNKVAIIRQGQLVVSGNTEELTHGETLESVFMEVIEHAQTQP